MGYFAHATRKVGDLSQYGEQTMVMLRALDANNGHYDARIYSDHFRAHFGYGGAYVGYIDHATRETLNNFVRAEDIAKTCAQALPFEGDPKITVAMTGTALALMKQHEGVALRAEFEKTARFVHDADDDSIAHGLQVLEALLGASLPMGAVDVQLPAISKLPGLLAGCAAMKGRFEEIVTSAVGTTNTHPTSIAFGQVCARMMKAAMDGQDPQGCVDAGRAVATPQIQELLEDAQARKDQSTLDVTKHFGLACDLAYGVPSVVHNILTAPSFVEAVRRNIYAGGDSCGRAMLLGALGGAVFGIGGERGIPRDWIKRLHVGEEVTATMKRLAN